MRDGTSSGAHTDGFWKRHMDKIGVDGWLFAAPCCLGFPALVSILPAVGLGFLVNHDMAAAFADCVSAGSIFGVNPWHTSSYNKSTWALIVRILSAVTTYGFVYVLTK